MSRPRRIAGHAYTGVQRYFLTTCTHDRAEFFICDDIVHPVVDRILQSCRQCEMAMIAYCVMPDHVHMLVDGASAASDFVRFASLAKQHTGYWFKQCFGARLWQKGYYEHILRDEESTEDVVFYIIANPVRKGLVERVENYPYWGSGICSREEMLASLRANRHP